MSDKPGPEANTDIINKDVLDIMCSQWRKIDGSWKTAGSREN